MELKGARDRLNQSANRNLRQEIIQPAKTIVQDFEENKNGVKKSNGFQGHNQNLAQNVGRWNRAEALKQEIKNSNALNMKLIEI